MPDLEASPDVFTWTWMLRGCVAGGESEARPKSRALAFFMLSTAETHQRLGIEEARGLHLSIAFVSRVIFIVFFNIDFDFVESRRHCSLGVLFRR